MNKKYKQKQLQFSLVPAFHQFKAVFMLISARSLECTTDKKKEFLKLFPCIGSLRGYLISGARSVLIDAK